MRHKLFLYPLLSILLSGCALPFGGGPLQQLYSTAVRKSYEIAREVRTPAAIASDNLIVLHLTDAFAQNDAINLLDMSPYCFNGRVYLIGEYGTEEEWAGAIGIAANEEGVRSVTTYILMTKGPPVCGLLDNFMIFANVRAKLIEDEEVRSTNIEIKVLQCQVVLMGILASPEEINRAIDHARGVQGVIRVQSFLEAGRIEGSAPETHEGPKWQAPS